MPIKMKNLPSIKNIRAWRSPLFVSFDPTPLMGRGPTNMRNYRTQEVSHNKTLDSVLLEVINQKPIGNYRKRLSIKVSFLMTVTPWPKEAAQFH
jgi:hypothetical protein